jgi:hypothetical protein
MDGLVMASFRVQKRQAIDQEHPPSLYVASEALSELNVERLLLSN